MHPGRALLALTLATVLAGGGFVLGRASHEESLDLGEPTATPTPTVLPKGPPHCGPALAKSTGGTWTCTFADEFDRRALDRTKWQVLTTGRSGYTNGGECFVDDADNVAVSGGALHLTLREEKSAIPCPGLPEGVGPTTPYTSGMVTTTHLFSQAYGRFEFRARFPVSNDPGLHSALWLWPQNDDRYGGRPAAGEIDVAEYFTAYPTRVVPYLHYTEAVPGQQVTTNTNCGVDRPDEFHTYSLEWTPDVMTIAYDGAICMQTTWQAKGLVPPAPFDVPFFVNLTQALGRLTNAPEGELPLPATLDVDYVRVWS